MHYYRYIISVILACISATAIGQQHGSPYQLWYKHYTGTIGQRHVIVNLYNYCSGLPPIHLQAGGNYIPDGDKYISLWPPFNVADDNEVILEEHSEIYNSDPASKEIAWHIHFDTHGITGIRLSKDSTISEQIYLAEDYTDAMPLAVVHDLDSTVYKMALGLTFSMHAQTIALLPAFRDRNTADTLVFHAIARDIGDTTAQNANDLLARIRHNNSQLFDDYRRYMADTSETHDSTSPDNWETCNRYTCVYNQQGLLQLEEFCYGYSGGAHGIFFYNYLCFDLLQHKLLQFADIIQPDSSELNRLLDIALRKLYHIPMHDALSKYNMGPGISVTHKIILSETGIFFCYDPYEIASYTYGQIKVFISYTALRKWLTPAFRKRMNIK